MDRQDNSTKTTQQSPRQHKTVVAAEDHKENHAVAWFNSNTGV
jgi:hypothetical protein